MSKINQIMKKLNKNNISKEVEVINHESFPEDLSNLLTEYYKIGNRTEFLWKWLYFADKVAISVFEVPAESFPNVLKITFLMNMFINLIDDASEKLSQEAFNEILKIPFENIFKSDELATKENDYIQFTKKIWGELIDIIKKLPSWDVLKEVFEFDIIQLINTTKYSRLSLKNPFILNEFEYWLFLPQNMQFIITLDICLMNKKELNKDTIGKAREMVMIAQKMARIGNDLGTWEREVVAKDFCSGVCAYAISLGMVRSSELDSIESELLIKKIKKSGAINLILQQWENSYRELKTEKDMDQKKLKENLIDAIEKITFYHLAGKHLI